ncbi:Asparagine-rich protein (ARP protein) [Desmophyllum pertusum]|uniref:Asparagine-rich protein (ARP protein) n=1 Tax=Desmophyllum pertusum TaxID=174260 RepID=A0A9X0CMV7_9CNID|nr:Asparagine-rich protein (ARP protein) [Desmophyllum pertusum]
MFMNYLRGFCVIFFFLVSHGAASCPMFNPPRDGIVTCVKNKPREDLSVNSPLKCKAKSAPSKIKSLGLQKYYYKGDASNLATQTEIKKTFKALLNEPYSRSSFCKENSLCTDNNIEILYDQESVHCASYGVPVGISDGRIANSSFQASSHYSSYPPWKARLNNLREEAWYGYPSDRNPWIQVDLGTPTPPRAVATKGKQFTFYVKTYQLGFSDDGKSWTMYKEGGNVKVFQGNTNYRQVVTREFSIVKARFFRIYPKTWNHGIALRFELYTCKRFT